MTVVGEDVYRLVATTTRTLQLARLDLPEDEIGVDALRSHTVPSLLLADVECTPPAAGARTTAPAALSAGRTGRFGWTGQAGRWAVAPRSAAWCGEARGERAAGSGVSRAWAVGWVGTVALEVVSSEWTVEWTEVVSSEWTEVEAVTWRWIEMEVLEASEWTEVEARERSGAEAREERFAANTRSATTTLAALAARAMTTPNHSTASARTDSSTASYSPTAHSSDSPHEERSRPSSERTACSSTASYAPPPPPAPYAFSPCPRSPPCPTQNDAPTTQHNTTHTPSPTRTSPNDPPTRSSSPHNAETDNDTRRTDGSSACC